MSEISFFSIAAATVASSLVLYISSEVKERSRRKGHARIPGPTRLPLLGNALQMPQSHGWLKLAEWKETYGAHARYVWRMNVLDLGIGDMIQLDLLGYHLVAVNSAKVARDLLDKRSASYSDRPHFVCLSGSSESGQDERR